MTGREKLLHDLDALKASIPAAIDALETGYTAVERHDLVDYIRRLQDGLNALRSRAEQLGTVSRIKPPPFIPGDRVRHPKFGDGTVMTAREVGAEPDGTPKAAGWRVTVEWENTDLGITDVMGRELYGGAGLNRRR